jgi:hypothetical protein
MTSAAATMTMGATLRGQVTMRPGWRWPAVFMVALAVVSAACTGDDDGGGDDGADATSGTESSAPADAQTPAMPEIEGPITGPGAMYVDPLELGFPESASAEASGYLFEEYFVSGTAAGEPYRVRAQVTMPGDAATEPFSGHAIVEAIHPQGIPFVWNFTREYLMSHGHAAVNVSVLPNNIDN